MTPAEVTRSIIAIAALQDGLEPEALLAGERARSHSVPRHRAMLAIRTLRRLSYPEIGRVFGGRDHSSAINGCRRARERAKSDPAELEKLAILLRTEALGADLIEHARVKRRLEDIQAEVATLQASLATLFPAHAETLINGAAR